MKIENIFSVKDKIVLITGGSRGIGEMIASGFVANGAKVYITARSKEVLTEIAEKNHGKYLGFKNNENCILIDEKNYQINIRESVLLFLQIFQI